MAIRKKLNERYAKNSNSVLIDCVAMKLGHKHIATVNKTVRRNCNSLNSFSSLLHWVAYTFYDATQQPPSQSTSRSHIVYKYDEKKGHKLAFNLTTKYDIFLYRFIPLKPDHPEIFWLIFFFFIFVHIISFVLKFYLAWSVGHAETSFINFFIQCKFGEITAQ